MSLFSFYLDSLGGHDSSFDVRKKHFSKYAVACAGPTVNIPLATFGPQYHDGTLKR